MEKRKEKKSFSPIYLKKKQKAEEKLIQLSNYVSIYEDNIHK